MVRTLVWFGARNATTRNIYLVAQAVDRAACVVKATELVRPMLAFPELLDQENAQAAQDVSAKRAAIAQAQKEYDKVQGEWYGVDQNFRFTKAKIDVAKYDYEEAAHHGKADRMQ